MPETVTISQIKDLIKEEKIQPSILFGRDQLLDDPFIKGYVEEERKNASGGEYAHRKRTDEAFDKARKEWEDKEKKYQEDINKMKIDGAKVTAADLFSKKIKERKLEDKQAKFVDVKREAFEPQNVDELEKEVDAFLDTTLEDYKKTAKIFGKEEKKEAGKTGGGEPGEGHHQCEGSPSHQATVSPGMSHL